MCSVGVWHILLSFSIDLKLLLVFVCFRFIFFLVFVIPINWWFVSFRFFSHMMHQECIQCKRRKKRYLDKPNWIWFVSRCAADAEENDWRRAMCLSFRRIIRWSIRCLKSQHERREEKKYPQKRRKERNDNVLCSTCFQ